MRIDKTSNPAFSNYFWNDDSHSSEKMTVTGIIIKTLLCLIVITIITLLIWNYYKEGQIGIALKWLISGGMLSAITISVVISVRHHWAKYLVPLYTIAKGVFLGGISSLAHDKFPDLPYQAIGITIVTFFTVLILYQTRIVIVTKKLKSIIITGCVSIFVIYIISWILSFFGIKVFIWGTSWPAIIFNVVAAFFASMALLLDFDYIERQKNKAPKEKEWLATWGLLVTLIWLYVEVLRLLKKLSIRF